jgi:hypothetical protein
MERTRDSLDSISTPAKKAKISEEKVGRVIRLAVKAKSKGKHEPGLPKPEFSQIYTHITGCEGIQEGNKIKDYNHYRTTRKKSTNDRSVSIMTVEIIKALNEEDWPIKEGDLGENIVVEGIDIQVGQKFRLGEAEICITEDNKPCNQLQNLPYVGKERKKEFLNTLKGRRGWFARVDKEGIIKKGDKIESIS